MVKMGACVVGAVLLLCVVVVFGDINYQSQTGIHNNYRKNVYPKGITPLHTLSWNNQAANTALNYAKQCNYAHNPNRGNYGENIYASSNSAWVNNPPSTSQQQTTYNNAATSWWNENQYYNIYAGCQQGQVCGACKAPSGKECGHYTQMAWNHTTSLGCGGVLCNKNSPFSGSLSVWYFVVCDYAPPGNYIGQYPYVAQRQNWEATPIEIPVQPSSPEGQVWRAD